MPSSSEDHNLEVGKSSPFWTSPMIQMRLDFAVIAASLNFASSGDDRIQ
jgi:hypothetical protein